MTIFAMSPFPAFGSAQGETLQKNTLNVWLMEELIIGILAFAVPGLACWLYSRWREKKRQEDFWKDKWNRPM